MLTLRFGRTRAAVADRSGGDIRGTGRSGTGLGRGGRSAQRVAVVIMALVGVIAGTSSPAAHASGQGASTIETIRESVALNPQGEWIVSDLVALLSAATPERAELSWQSIDAGTVLSGPQQLTIDVGGVGVDGTAETRVRLSLTLRDMTPPSLQTSIHATTEIISRAGAMPFVVAPGTVTVSATAHDAVDAAPMVVVMHNNARVESPLSIGAIGLHCITVEASDSSGNMRRKSFVFQIRPRELREAVVTVEALTLLEGVGAPDRAEVTLLLGASDFDAYGIHLGTTQLLMFDDTGALMARPALIQGIDLCEEESGVPEYRIKADDGRIGASFQQGFWRLTFDVSLRDPVGTSVPAGLIVAGRSALTRTADDFDYIAVAGATPVADAFGQLAAAHAVDLKAPTLPIPTPGTPGADPPITCEWKFAALNWFPDACAIVDPNANNCGIIIPHEQWATVELIDPVGKPQGVGVAVDEGCAGSAAATCSVATSGTLLMWLEPTPPCTECRITVRAWPRFDVRAEINPPATAVVGGYVAVSGSGINAVAVGGVAIGADAPTQIVLGPNWSIPIQIGNKKPMRRTFAAPTAQQNTMPECAAAIEIGSGAHIDVVADGWGFPLGDLYGHAIATLFNASPRISINAVVTKGPCRGMRRSEQY